MSSTSIYDSKLAPEVLSAAKNAGVEFISLRFTDVLGTQKSATIPFSKLEDVLSAGFWFDGSSIEGFARIHESDMLLVPDLSTFAPLPWTQNKVARVICDVHGIDEKPFEGDPRFVLKKQLAKAKEMGFDYFVGPELEFFLFALKEGKLTNGKPVPEPYDSGGYWDLDPLDSAEGIMRDLVPQIESMGVQVERLTHEVSPGQHEIGFRYGNALKMADDVLAIKEATKIMAKRLGLFASFMPKPVFGINGSGMHVHQSLWSSGENAFADAADSYGLSKTAKHFIAGQLAHAKALAAVVAPTVNSYKRLVPGYEAPVYICWARVNRSSLIRIPGHTKAHGKSSRCELRCPDPSCNPYLAFAAMLGAGMDGIKRKLEPAAPVEENVYHFDDEKLAKFYINTLPSSLGEAIAEFGKDGVIKSALGHFAASKLSDAQKKQWDEYRVQVTPWETENYLPIL
ncbi:MAG: type I glutamate--ammonia ligase [Candidatus Micrarchaeia archaeon]|jgi:glutamine synthetase